MSIPGVALSVIVLVSTGQFVDILPPEFAPKLPKETVVKNAPWEQVRESQEEYARELDALMQRLDPALAARAADYTYETDAGLKQEISACLSGDLPPDMLERRIEELLAKHPDRYEQGQVYFEGAYQLGFAIAGEDRARKAIAKALEMPLWPNQRLELYRVKGEILLREYRRQLGDNDWGKDSAYPEMRGQLAVEYLTAARAALDCEFPRALPNLQMPNMLESVTLPDDPAERQAVRASLAHRATVEAKAMQLLSVMRTTEKLRVRLELDVAYEYTVEPQNSSELETLAAEILHDPQEEAQLMRMLRMELAKAAAR